MSKLIYIACPFTADTPQQEQDNFWRSVHYSAYLHDKGIANINPLANTIHAHDVKPQCHSHWIKIDLIILERCDELHVLPGWETSKGCLMEIEFAKSKNIPTVFVEGEW